MLTLDGENCVESTRLLTGIEVLWKMFSNKPESRVFSVSLKRKIFLWSLLSSKVLHLEFESNNEWRPAVKLRLNMLPLFLDIL